MRLQSCHSRLSAALATAGLFTGLTLSSESQACGGLFCSTSNPVNQVAERIIFAQNPDDTITAVIEIQYEGPSDAFAWVLPVPAGDVTVGVSSKQALDALQAASNPVYSLQTTFESCGGDMLMSAAARGGTTLADTDAEEGPADVAVLASGAVGPYDWVIIEVDDSLDDRAQVAVDWLLENGFEIAGIGPEVLRIYLEQDMNLLAFRLSKNSDTGSIRPVLVSYPGERPMIPIQPTAVAAQDDMGILVWVLAEGRAVPTNYLALELNEARINWLDPSPTYNDVVIAAADEAGGFGFVTEHSGPADQFSQTIHSSYKDDEFDRLRTGQFASVADFLQQSIYFAQAPFVSSGPFGGGGDFEGGQELYDGFLDVLGDPEVVPLREGATAEQLLACVSCYFQVDVPVQNDAYPSTPYVPGEDPLDALNVTAFLDAVEAQVVAPLRTTRRLFLDHARVTRLYTTLSPEEMTIDPEFDSNADLGDVDNQHTADRVMHCDGNSWTITLPQGHTVSGTGGDWPVAENANALPYNSRTLQLSSRGDGEVLIDNYDDITSALIDTGVGGVDPKSPVAQERGSVGLSDDGGSGFCSFAGTRPNSLAAGLGLAGLSLLGFGWRRRRR